MLFYQSQNNHIHYMKSTWRNGQTTVCQRFGNRSSAVASGNCCRSVTSGNGWSAAASGNSFKAVAYENRCSAMTYGNGCSVVVSKNRCSVVAYGNHTALMPQRTLGTVVTRGPPWSPVDSVVIVSIFCLDKLTWSSISTQPKLDTKKKVLGS